MNRKVIIFVGSLPESLINFRGQLLKEVSNKKNIKLIAMASEKALPIIQKLQLINVSFQDYPISRSGLNPIADYMTWRTLRNIFKQEKPEIILAYTIKPIIWGGLASRVNPKTKFFALVTGLGFTFQKGNWKRSLLTKLVVFLYKISLSNTEKVIFQNPDNLQEFISRGIVPHEKCAIVNGSGVDIQAFSYEPPSLIRKHIVFLSIGRLLGEKGFREYAEAARIVKRKYSHSVFQLLGPEDPSPDGLSLAEVQKWQTNGSIDYLGSAKDVRPYLKSCSIYVLPSYHEGLPRTILEAMAIGRPILTTDVPGCRETVIPGKNGFLVPKADAEALAERMIWFIENFEQWERMGKCSREIAEDKYDVHKVNAQLMEIMRL